MTKLSSFRLLASLLLTTALIDASPIPGNPGVPTVAPQVAPGYPPLPDGATYVVHGTKGNVPVLGKPPVLPAGKPSQHVAASGPPPLNPINNPLQAGKLPPSQLAAGPPPPPQQPVYQPQPVLPPAQAAAGPPPMPPQQPVYQPQPAQPVLQPVYQPPPQQLPAQPIYQASPMIQPGPAHVQPGPAHMPVNNPLQVQNLAGGPPPMIPQQPVVAPGMMPPPYAQHNMGPQLAPGMTHPVLQAGKPGPFAQGGVLPAGKPGKGGMPVVAGGMPVLQSGKPGKGGRPIMPPGPGMRTMAVSDDDEDCEEEDDIKPPASSRPLPAHRAFKPSENVRNPLRAAAARVDNLPYYKNIADETPAVTTAATGLLEAETARQEELQAAQESSSGRITATFGFLLTSLLFL